MGIHSKVEPNFGSDLPRLSGTKIKTGVLLLHGLAGTPAELRFLEVQLAAAGHEVVTPMIAGLAGNSDVSGLSRWEDWVASAAKAYRALAERCDQVYVGGLSAGALLALKLAATEQRKPDGLLLFAPTFKPNGWAIPWTFKLFYLVHWRPFARLFEFVERNPFGIKDERIRGLVLTALQSEHSAAIFRINGAKVLEMLRLSRSARRDLGGIDVPTLIFHPRDDDQSALDNSNILQRRMAGRVELSVLDDSYHVVTLDRQRRYVADRTNVFISGRAKEFATRASMRALGAR